jgi:phage head maturation protease
MKLYAEISKTEEHNDGTIKVWGYASTGAVDSDGETITPEAMKAALPDYMRFGAVREMHQSKAAGTAIEANVEDDGKTWFGAHIVDSEACKKVKLGVYKGFSIGGKVTARDDLNKAIIKGIKLIEISLVDRPANPEAVMTMFKAERTAEDDVSELAALLDAGTITPGALLTLAKASVDAPVTATETVADEALKGGPGSGPNPGGGSTAESEQKIHNAKARYKELMSQSKKEVFRLWVNQLPHRIHSANIAEQRKSWMAYDVVARNYGKGVAEVAIKVDDAGELQKGMQNIANFALLLKAIHYLVRDQFDEAVREEDDSSIPAHLCAWMKDGIDLLQEMVGEEAAELSATIVSTPDEATGLFLADKALAIIKGDLPEPLLAKAGARFSSATRKALSTVHEQMKTCVAHLDAMGYQGDGDSDGEKAEASTDLAKVDSEATETVAKMSGEIDLLKAEIDALKAKRDAEPMPGRALLRAVTVSKADDALDATVEPDPALLLKGEALALHQIRSMYRK